MGSKIMGSRQSDKADVQTPPAQVLDLLGGWHVPERDMDFGIARSESHDDPWNQLICCYSKTNIQRADFTASGALRTQKRFAVAGQKIAGVPGKNRAGR